MTREQRLVTLAFLALAAVVVLALAGRASATPPPPIGQLSERLFEPVVVPASLGAAHQAAPDSLSDPERRSGERLRGAPENDGAPAPVDRLLPAPGPISAPEPTRTDAAGVGTANTATAQPSPSYLPPGAAASRSGTASTYGPGWTGWIALPEGPGWRVAVCGAGGCRTVVSTDAGPDRAMQRLGRIVDLDVSTFSRVCGVSWTMGLCPVTITYLGRVR